MTDRQRHYYLTLARRAYEASGSEQPFEAWRHAEVEAALGAPVRFRDFTNRDLDRVLAHFRGMTGDRSQQTADAEDGERRRLLYVVRQLRDGLPARYVHTILRNRFKVFFEEQLEALDLRTLTQLRYTLHARAHALSRRSGGGQSGEKGGEESLPARPAPPTFTPTGD